jgi:hypothetical protein
MIQAFLDGETSPETSLKISDHIADCAKCSKALADAEEESSFVFAVLEREIDALVPTQRLWTRINDTIAFEKSQTHWWQRLYGIVAASLANPSFAAATGILLVVGMIAVVWNMRSGVSQNDEIIFVEQPLDRAKPVTSNASGPTSLPNVTSPESTAPAPFGPTVASSEPEKRTTSTQLANFDANRNRARPQRLVYNPTSETQYMPAEVSYQKTIADLKQSVDGQKDRLLSPSERVEFERDLAVVNDSINRMQKVVRKNPRNQAARQVLYSSYQDKIDLLNSVGQREDLMAGLN